MDIWISFIRITLALATGLFGALGLLARYKDDAGRITKWGRLALGGILLSSSFSVILYALEASKSKAAADKAKVEAIATGQLLQNILAKAQMTANQQERTLDETNVLKEELQTTSKQQRLNLERSDYIAKGMRTSLVTQERVLSGNETILGGVTSAIEQTATTMHATQRLLQPLGEIRVAFWIDIARSRNTMAYLTHLTEKCDVAEKLFLKTGNSQAGEGVTIIPNENRTAVSEVRIEAGSPLLPKVGSRAQFLKEIPFYVKFFRDSVSASMWEASGTEPLPGPKSPEDGILIDETAPYGPNPDLWLHVLSTDSSFSPKHPLGIQRGGELITIYDPRRETFTLHGYFTKAATKSDNGSVSSVLDLPGLTMVVEFLNRNSELMLLGLQIEVAKGKRIIVDPGILVKQVVRGREFYFYKIRPEDIKRL